MAKELKGKITLDINSFIASLQTAARRMVEFNTSVAKPVAVPVTISTEQAKQAISDLQSDIKTKLEQEPIELPPIKVPETPENFSIEESLKKAKEEAAKLQVALAEVAVQGGKGSGFYNSLASQLKAATAQADGLEAALKEAGEQARTISPPKPSDAFTSSLRAAKDEAARLQAEIAQIAITQGKGSQAYTDAVTKLKAANEEADKLEQALKDAGDSAKEIEPPVGVFGGLTQQFKDAREQATAGGGIFGNIASTIGQLASPIGLATAAVGALTAGLAATFTIGQEFETNLKSVSAVTGVTGAALDDIGDRARNLAVQFGGSASEQLGVFQTTLSKIGPQLANDSEALSTFATSVNTLSKTDSALGAAGAVDALTGAMLQFGVNVNDSNEVAAESTRFINVLAASAAVGSASVSDVAAAIGVVGGTAKNANISFEETNAALQVLASKSLVGSQAGTALTAVVNKLQAASGPAADQLLAMGTSSQELGQILTTQGIGPAMDKLRTAMSSLGSDAEKNSFLVGLFGETGLNAAAALLQGGDKLKEYTEDVTGTQAAFEQAQINMSTLAERISRATAAVQDIAIATYQAILPVINQVFDFIDSIYQQIAPVLDTIKNQIGSAFANIFAVLRPIFAGIAALIGGSFVQSLTTTIGLLSAIASAISTFAQRVREAVEPVFTKLGALFGSAGSSALTLDNVIKAVGKTIEIFAGILAELGGFIAEVLVTPFQLLAGVIGNIVEFFQSFTTSAKAVKDEVKGTGEQAQKAAGLFETLGNAILKIPAFLAGLRAAFVEIKNIIFEFGEAITNVFSNGVGATFDKIYNLFADGAKRTGKAFDSGWNTALKEGEEKRKQEAAESGKAVGDAMAKGAVDAFAKLSEGLQRIAANKPNITDEQLKTEIANYQTQLQNALNLRQITQEQFKKLSDAADDLTKNSKDKEKGKNKEILDLLSQQYEERKRQNDLILSAYEIELKTQAAAENRALNEEETRKIAEKKLALDRDNLKAYEEIYKVIRDTNGILPKDVAIKGLDEGDVTKIKTDFISLLKSLADQQINLSKVKFDDTAIKTELEKIITSIDLSKGFVVDAADLYSAPIDFVFDAVTGAALSQSEVWLQNAQKKVEALNNFISDKEAQLRNARSDEEQKALKAQIERAQKEVKDSEKAISDERLRIKESEEARRLALLDDSNERELQEKLKALRREFAETIKSTRAEGLERAAIQDRYLDREAALIAEYRRRSARGFVASLTNAGELAVTEISKIFSEPFSIEVDAKAAEEAAEKVSELRVEQEKLLESLREGKISFQEYQEQVAALDNQIQELNDNLPSFDLLAVVGERISQAFGNIAGALRKTVDASVSEYEQYVAKIADLNDKLAKEIEGSSGYQKALEARNNAEQKAADITAGIYGTMAVATAASLGQMVAQQRPFLQAFVVSILDTLQAMVPVFTAMITGFSLASAESVATFGIAGIAKAAGITALLYAAVGAARAAVASSFGFKKGGYTGDGNPNDVKGVAHAGEVVLENPIVSGQKDEVMALRGLLQSGVRAQDILDAYRSAGIKIAREHRPISDVELGLRSIVARTDAMPVLTSNNTDLRVLQGEIRDMKLKLSDDLHMLKTNIRRTIGVDLHATVKDDRTVIDTRRTALRNNVKGA